MDNANPTSPSNSNIVKPQSIKYVTPSGVKSEPLTFANKNEPVPDLERKSSIGSEGSCFHKPGQRNMGLGQDRVQVNVFFN